MRRVAIAVLLELAAAAFAVGLRRASRRLVDAAQWLTTSPSVRVDF